jgi:hypothetical protein
MVLQRACKRQWLLYVLVAAPAMPPAYGVWLQPLGKTRAYAFGMRIVALTAKNVAGGVQANVAPAGAAALRLLKHCRER